MKMDFLKAVTWMPRKSPNPRFASSLTKALPFFLGASFGLSFSEREFHVEAGMFGGGWGLERTPG